MWNFYKAVIRSAIREFWTATDEVLSGVAVLSFFAILLSRKYGEHVVTTWNGISPWWSVIPIGLLAFYRLLRANYMQFARVKAKLDAMLGTTVLAEEDPKVYLVPLNAEYVSLGYMAFELSNRGQRVNPAQGITVHTISCTPSIRFAYVDCLDPMERKRVVPMAEDDIFPVKNILMELEQAWKDSWEGGKSDPTRVELEFQIKITYRDFRPRNFETTVGLKYCPLELHDLSKNSFQKHREYEFIKVTDTQFRRLS